ncbi:hypothetical protein N9B74_02855, partial [bacterium]|nr:hypothetical protein [bacterium]
MKRFSILPLAGAALALSAPLKGELVSHYQFDDPGSLGKDDGTFNLTGSVGGSAQFSNDSRLGGGSILLDGNGDYLNLGGATSFSGLDDDGDGFTLAAWIKADS